MPDDLHTAARRAGLNVSRLAQEAIADELARIQTRANGDSPAKTNEFDRLPSASL